MSWEANGRPPFLDWASVPGFDPDDPQNESMRYVFHQTNLRADQIEALAAKGWVAVDVRLMPDENDRDQRDRIKATLAGVRQGSIELSNVQLRALAEEMKIFKLNKGDEEDLEMDLSESEDLEQILDLTGNSPAARITNRRFTDENNQVLPEHKREGPRQ